VTIMPLHRASAGPARPARAVDANPFVGEANPALGQRISPPHEKLAEDPVPPDVAYQLIHDELLLDGSARLNLATFVTTWMEPQARTLMAECVDKNMIDKDEYPQTAELERALRRDPRQPVARAGSVVGDRVLDHRIERGVHARRAGAQAALGGAGDCGPPEPGHGRQRPGVLGEVLPLLGRGAPARPDGR
jgi:hypothetical protein